MEVTLTFEAPGAAQWQQIVDGATYSRFGVQVDCQQPVYLCISKGAPDPDTKDYMILEHGFTREITTGLSPGNVVSIRTATPIETAVRGFKEPRA